MIRGRTYAVAIALLLALCSPQLATAEDDPLRRGHALIIGTWKYNDPKWDPLNDIELQVNKLEKSLRAHFTTVDVVTNPTYKELRNNISEFIQKYGFDDNARLLIYYAGHGNTFLDRNRNTHRGAITGVDTPFSTPYFTEQFNEAQKKSMTMESFVGLVTDISKGQILVVFDSCFAGTVFNVRGVNNAPRRLSDEQINHLLTAPVRQFITAGDSDQVVPAHSPIPDLFMRAIDGEADYTGDGVVTGDEIGLFLLQGVRQQNVALTPRVGRPPIEGFGRGDFLFRPTVVPSSREIGPVSAPRPPPLVTTVVAGVRADDARAIWRRNYHHSVLEGTHNVIVASLGEDLGMARKALERFCNRFPDVEFRLFATVAKDGVSNERYAINIGEGISRLAASNLAAEARRRGIARDAYINRQDWTVTNPLLQEGCSTAALN